MYKVIYNKKINTNSYEMAIEAPLVIKNALPGQFVIIMASADGEKIPLSIYDIDKGKNILYVIYQVVGASTYLLSKETSEIYSVTGPLGRPSEICINLDKFKDKKIIYVAGGIGSAPVYNQVKYLKENNINIDVIYGARNIDLFIIKEKLEKVSNNLYYVSDDGSFGEKGFVTNVLERIIDNYDICVAIGPVIMMKNVVELTKKHNIRSIVSMNPIMVDGSGMCGACRCLIEGKPRFACIDGPEFDGDKVDFDSALKRMNTYKEEEKSLLEKFGENHG